ncbi:hypothetical protein PHMEG_00030703 [Phytophthora megakarya]|uniref:Eukaryotic/viral aspartic protease n=1 Tax=Phytophthora megakarya TaxID=4795 RepID=A0A225V0F8_9STRA|nr:hypothetical protein PHMEG_00030703 [Phytophthora megakarya]
MEDLDEVVGPEPALGDDDDEEREAGDDDSRQAVTTSQVTEQKTGYRPPKNGDTPAANKVLGRTYEEMMEKSTWIRLFEPKRIRRAVWTDLSHEPAVAVTATTTGQVASDTVLFLKSMRLQAKPCRHKPSWSRGSLPKLTRMEAVGFGVTDIHYPQPPVGKTAGGGVDPSEIPHPKTPSNGYNTVPKSHGVFSKSGDETPYFQDSHMITPKSSGRKERPDHDSGRGNATLSTVRGSRRRWDRNRYDEDEASSDEDEDLYRRPQQDGVLNEYIRQIEKASSPERERLTQKIELATHRPLGQIRAFSGLRKKVRNSMQWLRGFVYEMKGTRASPDEWCMPFQLSWKGGALHWHRQLPKKTKLTWSLLSSSFIRYYCAQYNQTAETRYYSAKREDKEHLCDYLNRLNGRPEGTRSREAIPGNLWRSWTRTKIVLYDIHELEERIIEIPKVDDRESAKGSSQSRSRSHDTSRSKRSDHPRDSYSRGDRRDRDFGRRRDDSRNIPRVTYTEGSKALKTKGRTRVMKTIVMILR